MDRLWSKLVFLLLLVTFIGLDKHTSLRCNQFIFYKLQMRIFLTGTEGNSIKLCKLDNCRVLKSENEMVYLTSKSFGGRLIWQPHPKITSMELDRSWKFHKDPFILSNVIQLFNDTQTHGHMDTQAHRHTDTQTHRHTDTQTHRHTDTQTHRHIDT